jgi:PAS domain S-box-containing protein
MTPLKQARSTTASLERAERAAREIQARFRLVAETIDEVFWIADQNNQTLKYISPAYERIWGRSCQSLHDNPRSFLDAVLPEDLDRVTKALEAQASSQPFSHEYRILRPDGQVRRIWHRGFPVASDDGDVREYVGIAQDVTEQRTLEEQYRQAQKMEAVGHLAGGIAHDFNNALMVIGGFSRLAMQHLEASHPAAEELKHVLDATDRAATLTQRLLAFSRQQVLQSTVLNLADVVDGLAPMLHHLIGESIALRISRPARLSFVFGDRGQLEQALMNLVLNARDAMPDGGEVTITTCDSALGEEHVRQYAWVRPGPYVKLTVSDTGHGMDAATQKRVFEPFFTTKPKGVGTGLGLSMVYGLVKQSDGFIFVHSEVGEGTTFDIYLPITAQAPEESRPVVSDHTAPEVRGAETILLVEDQETVRSLVSRVLVKQGYTVHAQPDAKHALDFAAAYAGPIHLILTDVILPGMNGSAMATQLLTHHPRARVLFMSGYTDETIDRHGVLGRGTFFLQKPFTGAALLSKVREVLTSEPSAG